MKLVVVLALFTHVCGMGSYKPDPKDAVLCPGFVANTNNYCDCADDCDTQEKEYEYCDCAAGRLCCAHDNLNNGFL